MTQMKRAGILTFLHNDNYGSSLQAYALQRVIREIGYEAEHIDYCPDRLEKIRNMITSGNSPKLILEGIRKRSVKAGQAGARAKNRAIPAFYEREMKLSPACRNRRELKQISSRYNLLICGSDQIWNPVWMNPAYFLDFAEKGKKKLAYAPSLGVRELKDSRKRKKIRRLTEDFEALSAREAEGAALLREITGREAEVLPDPVCLLSRENWSALAEKADEASVHSEKCLVCYFIGENPVYWIRVRELEKETGLPVRVIPVTAESYASGFSLLDGIGPEGFLRAIRDAECFCTDSFHGLVFGTIFGVRTVPLKRYREDDPESKNSRVEHFLRETQRFSMEEIRMKGMNWLRNNL